MEFRGVEEDLIPNVEQPVFPNVPIKGSLTLMYIASLMVLVRVCDFLPTMEKLSNLV